MDQQECSHGGMRGSPSIKQIQAHAGRTWLSLRAKGSLPWLTSSRDLFFGLQRKRREQGRQFRREKNLPENQKIFLQVQSSGEANSICHMGITGLGVLGSRGLNISKVPIVLSSSALWTSSIFRVKMLAEGSSQAAPVLSCSRLQGGKQKSNCEAFNQLMGEGELGAHRSINVQSMLPVYTRPCPT